MLKQRLMMLSAMIAVMLAGCASAPTARPQQQALESNANGTLQAMVSRDPSLAPILASAAGYVVFPSVAQGGFIVGGEGGVGVAYEHNRPIGYSELRGGSVGLQAGGQSYAQIVVFQTPAAFARFRAGNFDLSANMAATALQTGAARSARFENGVAVFVDDQSGLMAGVSVAGESMTFTQNRPTATGTDRNHRGH
jgi:lipid-binding SYLF domain-containing protein